MPKVQIGDDQLKNLAITTVFALLILPAGLFAMSKRSPVHVSHPVVSDVSGTVLVRGKCQSVWERVEDGTLLLSGDVLRTEPEASARIRFASGTIEVYENSEILIPSTGDRERKKDIRELVVILGSAFLDVDMTGTTGTFGFEAGIAYGRSRASKFTLSHAASRTVIKLYEGEATVLHADGSGERTSSLIAGSSLKLEAAAAQGRIVLFDPVPALKKYSKNITPLLDPTTGLPVAVRNAPGGSEIKRPRTAREGGDRDKAIGYGVVGSAAASAPSDENILCNAVETETGMGNGSLMQQGVYLKVVPEDL